MGSLGQKNSSHKNPAINGAAQPQPRSTRITKLTDLDKIYVEWEDFVLDAQNLISQFDLNLRSNGGKNNVWKCRETECLFKLKAGRKNKNGGIVVERKACFFTHNHDVYEVPKSKRAIVVKKEHDTAEKTKAKKLKIEQDSDHEDVAALFAFLDKLAPGVFSGLERIFLSVGLKAPLLYDTHEEELGGILEALKGARYLHQSLDEALIKRFQRKMSDWIEGEERRKGMRDAGVGGE